MPDTVIDFAKWANDSQLAGAVLGVLIGYFVGAFFSWRAGARSQQRIRTAINVEIRLNATEASLITEALWRAEQAESCPDNVSEEVCRKYLDAWRAYTFAASARPQMNASAWHTYMSQAGDALDRGELNRMIKLSRQVQLVVETWDAYQSAGDRDDQWFANASRQQSNSGYVYRGIQGQYKREVYDARQRNLDVALYEIELANRDPL